MSKFSLWLTYSTCKNAKRKPQQQKSMCVNYTTIQARTHWLETLTVWNSTKIGLKHGHWRGFGHRLTTFFDPPTSKGGPAKNLHTKSVRMTSSCTANAAWSYSVSSYDRQIMLPLFACFWRDSPQWARASSFTRFSRSHTTTHHSR